MSSDYQVDSLDKKILSKLLEDARTPFTEIAKDLIVSTGTIHQRVEKMKAAGIIKGFRANLDYAKLGMPIVAIVGIHLNNAKDITEVYEAMKQFKQVSEVHFTTGNYALMAKIISESIPDLYRFLTEQLQALKPIRSTETFLCLSTPIEKAVEP